MAQADGWHEVGHEGVRELSSGRQSNAQTDLPPGILDGVQPGSAAHRATGAPGSSLSALVHDTRNLVASIALYCDLLDEPGVLSRPFRHYAGELRKVAQSSHRLLDRISALSSPTQPYRVVPSAAPSRSLARNTSAVGLRGTREADAHVADKEMVESLAGELKANQHLLAALAGPQVAVDVCLLGGSAPVAMTADDLSRILINLTRNSVEAMQGKGRIQITLEELPARLAAPELPDPGSDSDPGSRTASRLRLTFADTGPGIPEAALEAVFSPGFTTHLCSRSSFAQPLEDSGVHGHEGFYDHGGLDESDGLYEADGLPDDCGGFQPPQRGLGLAIVRSLASAAGGTVRAISRAARPGSGEGRSSAGASIVLEFPVTRLHATGCECGKAPVHAAIDATSNGPPRFL